MKSWVSNIFKQNNNNNNNTNNYNINNNNSNNNINCNNNIEYCDILFLKVWNNIVIRNVIIKFLKIYKIHYYRVDFKDLEELNQYPYKEYLHSIRFKNQFQDNDLIIFKESIPKSVKIITFPPKFKSTVDSGIVPDQITEIYLHYDYQIPITKYTKLPPSLTCIHAFQFSIHPLFVGMLQNSAISSLVKKLDKDSPIRFKFDKQTKQMEINKSIKLSHVRDTIITPIPTNLGITSISFGYHFDQNIRGLIPDGVSKIKFNGSFKTPISRGTIPNSVTEIKFKTTLFNEPLPFGCLPVGLKKFEMCNRYDQLQLEFPTTLTHLKLGSIYAFQIYPTSFSPSLVYLDASLAKSYFTFKDIPPTIETLCYSIQLNDVGLSHIYARPLQVPDSVTNLVIHDLNIFLPDNYFPKHTKSIIFQRGDFQSTASIHRGIKSLTLPNSFQSSLEFLSSPETPTIEYLEFGSHSQFQFDCSIEPNLLPSSLLILNVASSNPILPPPHQLPPNLIEIQCFSTNKLFLSSNNNLLNYLPYLKIIKNK